MSEGLVSGLRSAAIRAVYYRTGEARLLNAAADSLEAAEARVKELEAEAKDHKAEQVFRISELQELGEAQARIAELEAGEWEYAQAVITDDDGGLYLGKSFGDDPTRALDEGYVLVRRHVGLWVPVESEGE